MKKPKGLLTILAGISMEIAYAFFIIILASLVYFIISSFYKLKIL